MKTNITYSILPQLCNWEHIKHPFTSSFKPQSLNRIQAVATLILAAAVGLGLGFGLHLSPLGIGIGVSSALLTVYVTSAYFKNQNLRYKIDEPMGATYGNELLTFLEKEKLLTELNFLTVKFYRKTQKDHWKIRELTNALWALKKVGKLNDENFSSVGKNIREQYNPEDSVQAIEILGNYVDSNQGISSLEHNLPYAFEKKPQHFVKAIIALQKLGFEEDSYLEQLRNHSNLEHLAKVLTTLAQKANDFYENKKIIDAVFTHPEIELLAIATQCLIEENTLTIDSFKMLLEHENLNDFLEDRAKIAQQQGKSRGFDLLPPIDPSKYTAH